MKASLINMVHPKSYFAHNKRRRSIQCKVAEERSADLLVVSESNGNWFRDFIQEKPQWKLNVRRTLSDGGD